MINGQNYKKKYKLFKTLHVKIDWSQIFTIIFIFVKKMYLTESSRTPRAGQRISTKAKNVQRSTLKQKQHILYPFIPFLFLK